MASQSLSILSLLLLPLSISTCLETSTVFFNLTHPPQASPRTDPELQPLYENWLIAQNKVYNDLVEKDNRFEIFKENLRFIEEHNEVANRSYRVGLNRFADMTNEEYMMRFLGMKGGRRRRGRESHRYVFRGGDELPEAVDWRERGTVGEVKSQGYCGSCWAFSTIAAIEGINQIITGEFISLSEQELEDCDRSVNSGCNGGYMQNVFEFFLDGGIDTDKDYPYKVVDGTCDHNKKNARAVIIDDYEDVPQYDEMSLKKAVANQPVSVSIDASGRAFQLYESGIFTAACGTNIDHALVAIGYGSENGVDYWILRNSWGKNWGENGYIRMERNIRSPSGRCGIALDGSYPIKSGLDPPKLPTVCDDYNTCPYGTTCCCVYEYGDDCFGWGCCPLESATCCDDHSSCCPYDYPICDLDAGTCLMSKDNPLGVKALKRVPAKRRWPSLKPGSQSISS